jgi:hypothetical protein
MIIAPIEENIYTPAVRHKHVTLIQTAWVRVRLQLRRPATMCWLCTRIWYIGAHLHLTSK